MITVAQCRKQGGVQATKMSFHLHLRSVQEEEAVAIRASNEK